MGNDEEHRLHKPGVSGSSPDAATDSKSIPNAIPRLGEGQAEVRHGEPIRDYHADRDYLNASTISLGTQCMSLVYRKFFAEGVDQPDEDGEPKSTALANGDIAHRSLELGRQRTQEVLLVAPSEHQTQLGLSTKKATKEWLATLDPDTWVVSQKQADFINNMWRHIDANAAVAALIEQIAHHEVSIRFRYLQTLCRVRPDAILDTGRLLDWKTTRHPNPLKQFWKSVLDFNYHISHALYLHGAEAAGFSTQPMVYVAISTSGSGAVQAMTLPQKVIDHGRRTLDRLLLEINAREVLGDWQPEGYGSVNEVEFPSYAMKDMK